jgi:hypothetical protein
MNLDWQKNSKTKVEKAFSFIFMSSYPEMSFFGPKKREKVLKYGPKYCFLQIGRHGYQKSRNFTLISK